MNTAKHRTAGETIAAVIDTLTEAQLRRLADPSETPESARARLLADSKTVPCAVIARLQNLGVA